MIVSTTELGLEGARVCGQVLAPCDGDSVYAIYRMKNCSCGLTVEKGSKAPYLRLTPGIQLPRELRASFERFQFECDDESMVDLELDRGDGELTLRRGLRSADDPAAIEEALAPMLTWVDEVAYPALIEHIRSYYTDEEYRAQMDAC